MYICLIGLFLTTFQFTCDGAPDRSFPALRLPVDVSQVKKLVEKRALCTDDQLDKNDYCPNWAAKGYCSGIYEQFMQTTCYASCGNCEVPPTRPPPPTPPPKVDEDACLAAHNAKRALHQNTNPLTWSDTLAQHAKAWADTLAAKDMFKHDPNRGNEGENLYWFYSSADIGSCAQAVDSWYDEIKDYDYNNPKFSSATGHFTQVVWKATTQVGAALVVKKNSKGHFETYVVARYSPPGNYRGQFGSNVMPTKN